MGARKSSILNRMQLDKFQSSTKIEALREELARMLQRDPSAKAIVFSQVLCCPWRWSQISDSCTTMSDCAVYIDTAVPGIGPNNNPSKGCGITTNCSPIKTRHCMRLSSL